MRRESGSSSTTDLEFVATSSATPPDVLRSDPVSSDGFASYPAMYWPNLDLPLLGALSGQYTQQDWTIQPDYIPSWNWDPLGASAAQNLSTNQISQNLYITGWDGDVDAYILQWAQYNQTVEDQLSTQL